MRVDKCLKNVRCDCGGCKNFAIANIDTNGYKGSICVCRKCFDDLCRDITKLKKSYQTTSIKKQG